MRAFLFFLVTVSVLSAAPELQASLSDMKEALYKLIEERKTLASSTDAVLKGQETIKKGLDENALADVGREQKIEKLDNDILSLSKKIENVERLLSQPLEIRADERHIRAIREYIQKRRSDSWE